MSANNPYPAVPGETFARKHRRALRRLRWLAIALFFPAFAHAQEIEKVQPAGTFRKALLSKPLGFAREVAATGHDFATFRDPQWSILTIAQIGAATADGVTTLNNLHSRPSYSEIGVSRFFVGAHPDAHKYIVAGIVEIGVEAVAAHYFRSRGPARKWYWKARPWESANYGHLKAV